MIMPSAALASEAASIERVENCLRDGAPFVASRVCPGEEPPCGYCLHSALLADARTAVAILYGGEDYSDTDAALALATAALAGSGDDTEVLGLAGRLILS